MQKYVTWMAAMNVCERERGRGREQKMDASPEQCNTNESKYLKWRPKVVTMLKK